MADSTHTRPGPEEAADAGAEEEKASAELLVRINRLPEPSRALVHQYIDVCTSDQRRRLKRLDERVDRIEEQLQWAAGVLQSMGATAGEAVAPRG